MSGLRRREAPEGAAKGPRGCARRLRPNSQGQVLEDPQAGAGPQRAREGRCASDPVHGGRGDVCGQGRTPVSKRGSLRAGPAVPPVCVVMVVPSLKARAHTTSEPWNCPPGLPRCRGGPLHRWTADQVQELGRCRRARSPTSKEHARRRTREPRGCARTEEAVTAGYVQCPAVTRPPPGHRGLSEPADLAPCLPWPFCYCECLGLSSTPPALVLIGTGHSSWTAGSGPQ